MGDDSDKMLCLGSIPNTPKEKTKATVHNDAANDEQGRKGQSLDVKGMAGFGNQYPAIMSQVEIVSGCCVMSEDLVHLRGTACRGDGEF